MPRERFAPTGYHSRIDPTKPAHGTRASFDYALMLLDSPKSTDHDRALLVIDAALKLQDIDPTRKTYGIWPWFLEEPLEQMSPPDWNWADFCGARIAHLLVVYGEPLPVGLQSRMRESLGHAAWSIFRRNIGPDYTNIAIMGGVVTAVAGELLGEPRLLDYGRRRLANVVAHLQWHGDFVEYNSPTYTLVVLEECERALQLIRDEGVRTQAEILRRHVWKVISEHWHPATRQWAGPHSRAYADSLDLEKLAILAARVDLGGKIETNHWFPTRSLPCPAEYAERFLRLPSSPWTIRNRFIRREPDSASSVGTTYFSDVACLSSMSGESLWQQRRPLLGYWKSGDDLAVLRLRFLKDGNDFASAGVHCVQDGPRIGASFRLGAGGDSHLLLDRPKDGIFTLSMLQAALELQAPDAKAETLEDGLFQLRAGDVTVLLRPRSSHFDGRPVTWETRVHDGKASIIAVCYRGEERRFDSTRWGPFDLEFDLELLDGASERIATDPL